MTEVLTALPEPPLFSRKTGGVPFTPTPATMLQAAIERGMDAGQLEKMMALYHTWEQTQAEKAFAAAMHACQQEMPSVIRDARNEQTKSRYATLENVQHVARPIYTKHGFSLCYGEADCPLPTHKRTICDVTHDAGHTRQYHLDLPLDGVGPKGGVIGGMNAVQASVSTTSYGQRRLLCMIFNITVANEDRDGQDAATVTGEQAATIREWLVATATNEKKFLEWAGCNSVASLSARKYDMAVNFFRRKMNGR